MVSQLPGLPLDVAKDTFLIPLLVIIGTGILVGLARFPKVIENPGQFMGSGSDGFWATQTSTHSAVIAPQGTGTSGQALSTQAKGISSLINYLARFATLDPPSRNPVVWAESKPGDVSGHQFTLDKIHYRE